MADLDITQLNWLAIARFWSKVQVGGIRECWPWTGARYESGHGSTKIQGATHSAHRVAFQIATGQVLSVELVLRHECDNPPCCNPLHLRTGTHLDNVLDRVRKKRSAKGERSGRAKLTEEQVRHIADSEMSVASLARMYGVTRHTIESIRQRRIWKHLWA